MNNDKTSADVAEVDPKRMAIWVLKLAKEQGMSGADLAGAVELSRSYFAKLKRGDIAKFPMEKLDEIARVLDVSRDRILELAEAKPKREADLFQQPADRLKFVFHHSVPDHCWPLIALKKRFFQDVNIEIDVIPKPLSDYPKSHRREAQFGSGDTVFIMPLPSLGDPAFENAFDNVTPIAVTHLYHGFPFIGRNPSKIEPLASPATDAFDHLMLRLASRNVLKSRSIAYVAKPEQDFFQLVWSIAARRPRLSLEPPDAGAEWGDLSATPSESFLEELWEIGDRGRDFVVGHAMSLAIALRNPSRYKVIFDFKRIEALLETAISEASLDPALADKKTELQQVKQNLQELCLPVAFILNTGPKDECKLNPEAREGLTLRLRSVADRAVDQILRNISDTIADEILEKIQFPKSTIGDDAADAASFRKAWQRCYSFEQVGEVRGPKELVSRLDAITAAVDAKKDACQKKLAEIETKLKPQTRQPSDPALLLYSRAQAHWENFNFYDAFRSAEEAARKL